MRDGFGIISSSPSFCDAGGIFVYSVLFFHSPREHSHMTSSVAGPDQTMSGRLHEYADKCRGSKSLQGFHKVKISTVGCRWR